MAGKHPSVPDGDCTPELGRYADGDLTPEAGRYWLRAAEWSEVEAVLLLIGNDPRLIRTPPGDFDIVAWAAEEWGGQWILDEIRHVRGGKACGGWSGWTPAQWLDAARPARALRRRIEPWGFGSRPAGR